MLNNKNILITGGTGSFGQKFVEIVLKKFKPKKLIIFSRGESKQSLMAEKFSTNDYKCIRYFIGDVRDFDRLKIATRGIDIIIHAAAMKQVPASEYNPIECIKTNIYGAQNLVLASIENNVKKVVALSTDKAVNPINLYGASKLSSDKLIISANNLSAGKGPIFSVVRYGNVYGSTGSVVELFEKLKNSNKPFPITNKSMTRFIISLDQGVMFVLRSLNMMKGGEIFLPKMPSIKIIDLAKAINQSKRISIIGIRPGEKIHESMTTQDDNNLLIEFKNYFKHLPSYMQNAKEIKRYKIGENGEIGNYVSSKFSYTSDKNKFLNIKEIRKFIINQKKK
jgi:UDP-N-acetylglucosamine 4,6-dehydratase